MAEVYPVVELPWDGEQHERSWFNVADNMEKILRECVAHLWDELMALDLVVAGVAEQFDGEDPLRPVMRGVLEKARLKLSTLHEFFSGKDAVEVTEPSEEALELVQTYFESGVRLMERI